MYPRNNASPERVAVGQVVLIADGTIQSTGVAITVRGQGGAEAASAGTIAYGADNTVYYTPTQAETSYTSFVLIASKASCFSVSQTIITSAASTAGEVVSDAASRTASQADVSSLATSAALAAVDAVVDSILVDTGTTLDTKINDIQGGTFSSATDSLEAIRDRGDSAWTTGAGGSSPTVVQIRQEMDSNSTKLIDIVADTNELQSDWVDAGRLDLILDSRMAEASINTTAGAVDTVTDASVTAAVANQIADHVLRRAWANAEASSDGDAVSFRSLLGAVAKLVNRVGITGTDLLTYRDDDSTVLGTQALTTDASADPITGIDTT